MGCGGISRKARPYRSPELTRASGAPMDLRMNSPMFTQGNAADANARYGGKYAVIPVPVGMTGTATLAKIGKGLA